MVIHTEEDLNRKRKELAPSFFEGIAIMFKVSIRAIRKNYRKIFSISKMIDKSIKIATVESSQKVEPTEEGKVIK